jgi:hypothetical protein
MQPYVIRRGDFLLKIAYKLGFDADTVWNDPLNDDLRKLRPDPNFLLAGDLMYVPDQTENDPPTHDLAAGSTTTFVTPPPPTHTLHFRFVNDDGSVYASKDYTIQELPDLTGLSTDGDGFSTFEAPVTLDKATIVFTETGEQWSFQIGGIDPINSLSGVFQRLQNLGFIGRDVQYVDSDVASNLGIMREALEILWSMDPDGRDSAESSASTSASSDDDDSDDDSDDDDSDDDDSDDDDNAGLSDDGTLDESTQNLLLKIYES